MRRFGSCLQSVLDDALAGAGLADDEAECALLPVDAQRLEDLLLMREEREIV